MDNISLTSLTIVYILVPKTIVSLELVGHIWKWRWVIVELPMTNKEFDTIQSKNKTLVPFTKQIGIEKRFLKVGKAYVK